MKPLNLSPSEKAEFLEAARLCGSWLSNNQNTPENPWGEYAVDVSADRGRFLEKGCPSRSYNKPAGIWLTGLYICSLIELKNAPILDIHLYENAVIEGSKYLKSLQCFDARWEKAIGGFHETYPGDTLSYPRDGATGSFAMIALFLDTGKQEYLDNAIAFADWYASHGSDEDGFPWCDYDLEKGKGSNRVKGDWQSGGALIYFYLYKITKDEKWKQPLKKVLDSLEIICAAGLKDDSAYDFHGECTISVGNDDFTNTLLLVAYEVFKEKRYLELFAERIKLGLQAQDQRGAFPGYGGTFVTALELLEALECSKAWGIEILPEQELIKPLLKAAKFSLSLQSKKNPSRFMLGGVYGQSNYAYARDVVHGRDTGYALQLWLRLAGHQSATYSALAWDK